MAETAAPAVPPASLSAMDPRKLREQRIIDAAVALAEGGGFGAVRARQICEQADVSMGTLYRHFGSIEEILLTAAEKDFGDFETLFPAGLKGEGPIERMAHLFGALLAPMSTRPNYVRAILAALAAGQSKALKEALHWDEMIVDYLEHAWTGTEPTRSQPETESRFIARTLHRVWFTVMVGWSAGTYDDQAVQRELIRTSHMMRKATTPA